MVDRQQMTRRGALALGVTALAAAACSSGDSKDGGPASPAAGAAGRAASPTQAGAAGKPPFGGVVATSELVVGSNRFALGIIDSATNQPVPDAQVNFRFFTVQGNQGTLRFESPSRFIAPARDASAAAGTQHAGGNHPQNSLEEFVGVYIAQVAFDQPGSWGVEAAFKTKDGKDGKVTLPFEVLAESTTPAVGTPAPRTRNLTVRDVKDLKEIDSAAQPLAVLHQETVADAIAAGKPVLVVLATPGFCETRFCGPTVEIVEKLVPKYGDKAALIHIEIWKDGVKRIPFEAVTEWRLRTEPYIFVVDRNGIITAKFEGPVSLGELDEELRKVTA